MIQAERAAAQGCGLRPLLINSLACCLACCDMEAIAQSAQSAIASSEGQYHHELSGSAHSRGLLQDQGSEIADRDFDSPVMLATQGGLVMPVAELLPTCCLLRI